MIVAVLCTGESLTQADVDYCRGKCKVVAVSDAIFMAPWADAMVSFDKAWWIAHPEVDYQGPKYMGHPEKVRGLDVDIYKLHGGNSGTLGLAIAFNVLKASRVLLLGADLKGTHFFGPHQRGLRNTQKHQFLQMKKQFACFKKYDVVNCSPDSALECFRFGRLRHELQVLQPA